MDLLEKIDILIGETGETVGTTTPDVEQVPSGTKKMFKKKRKKLSEGLRGENYHYEWNLMNKSEKAAEKALDTSGFKKGGPIGYKNPSTKDMADIQKTKDGWKINIYDSHGKKLA